MRDKEELFNSLKSVMSEKEFETIGDKIHRYLRIYAGKVDFETFSFTTNQGRVESIKFYTRKLSSYKIFNGSEEFDDYRKLTFDQYGDVFSVHHFSGGKCVTGLCRKALDAINNEVS